MDTSRTGAVGDGVIVDAEMGGHALKRVFVGFPFDEGETVEHGQNTDIDAIVLYVSLRTQILDKMRDKIGVIVPP